MINPGIRGVVIWLGSFFLLATAVSAIKPGLKVRISQKGLDYGKKIIILYNIYFDC